MAALSKTITPEQRYPVAWRADDETKRQTRIAWLPMFALSDLERTTAEWA